MQVARGIRLLSLPAAIVLGTALAVACSSGGPTSPDQGQAGPLFAQSKSDIVDDFGTPSLGNKDCPGGYALFDVGIGNNEADVNGNNNGFICQKKGGGGGKK